MSAPLLRPAPAPGSWTTGAPPLAAPRAPARAARARDPGPRAKDRDRPVLQPRKKASGGGAAGRGEGRARGAGGPWRRRKGKSGERAGRKGATRAQGRPWPGAGPARAREGPKQVARQAARARGALSVEGRPQWRGLHDPPFGTRGTRDLARCWRGRKAQTPRVPERGKEAETPTRGRTQT